MDPAAPGLALTVAALGLLAWRRLIPMERFAQILGGVAVAVLLRATFALGGGHG